MNQPISLAYYLQQKAPCIKLEQLSHRHTIVCANIQQTQMYTDWINQRSPHTQIQPKILSLNQWLEQHYLNQESTSKKIITHNQQLVIWHKIIKKHIDDHTSNLSWQRAEQYHHYHQHECQFNHNNHATQDPEYQYCANIYLEYLSQRQWIDHAILEKTLCEWLQNTSSEMTTFKGFNLLTHSLKQIINHLPVQSLFTLSQGNTSGEEQVIKLKNDAQQIHYLANYIKEKHEKEPSTRTGIILPRHSDQQHIITPACEYIKQMFDVHHIDEKIATLIPESIATQPLVTTLNSIVKFFSQPDTQKLIEVFKTPICQENNHQSQYQACLSSIQSIPYHILLDMSKKGKTPTPLENHTIWNRIAAFIQTTPPAYSTFHQWQQWVTEVLNISLMHYETINNQEQTLFQHWLECIHRCHNLCNPHEEHSHNTWIEYMILGQKNTYLNTKPARQAQFVLMSWSHAIDMTFDELIFVSNHAGNWPANIVTDQKHINKSLFWQQIRTQLRQSCKKITYLFPKHDAQMQERLPSALTPKQSIPSNTTEQANPRTDCPSKNSILQAWEIQGSKPKDKQLTISTSVVQDYNRCHAQGYFRHRLHVKPIEEKFYNIDAMDIGNLVHHVLQELDHVENTLVPDAQQQEQTIKKCIHDNSACRYLTNIQKSALHAHLQHVIQTWIDYRIDAHHDEKILNSQHEVALQKPMFGVTFNMRMDRIDQLADGSYRIIDYKTGMVNRADWLSKRPQNPQLIVYALCIMNTSSIAYAGLHPDYYGYQGYCAGESTISGIKSIQKINLAAPDETTKIMNSWPQQMRMWESAIHEIIHEYRNGSLKLNPVQGKTTCQLCQLQSLCRLHERNTHREDHEQHSV